MRPDNWTPKDDATAQAMSAQGISIELIGERLRRTPEAVKRRLGWMRLTPERRAEIGRTRTRNRQKQSENA